VFDTQQRKYESTSTPHSFVQQEKIEDAFWEFGVCSIGRKILKMSGLSLKVANIKEAATLSDVHVYVSIVGG